MRIVRELVEYRKQNKINANDFLGILSSMKQESGTKLSLEQMAAQVFVFFLGGFDISSSTLSFILYELALQQEIQDKLGKEIRKAYDNNNIISL